MQTEMPRRPKLDSLIQIAISPDDKRRLFEAAAIRRMTVSEMVRSAALAMTQEAEAA